MTVSMPRTALRAVVTASAVVATAVGLTSCSLFGDEKVEVTVPDALVEAGTTVPVGETVRVPGEADDKESNSEVDAEIGMTVVSITESDASFFDKLDNGDEFAGYTPWLVVVQYDLPAADAETLEDPSATSTYGMLDNGEYAEFLTLDFGSSGDISDFCPGARNDDADCDVLLVPEGQSLVSVEWDGLDTGIGGITTGDENSPYAAAPLKWELP